MICLATYFYFSLCGIYGSAETRNRPWNAIKSFNYKDTLQTHFNPKRQGTQAQK
jgi:hypothetical protein